MRIGTFFKKSCSRCKRCKKKMRKRDLFEFQITEYGIQSKIRCCSNCTKLKTADLFIAKGNPKNTCTFGSETAISTCKCGNKLCKKHRFKVTFTVKLKNDAIINLTEICCQECYPYWFYLANISRIKTTLLKRYE